MISAPDPAADEGPLDRRFRPPLHGALALGRARLRATSAGRLGIVAAVAVSVLYGGIIVTLRVEDGPNASFGGTLRTAAGALAWAAAGPMALAAARDRAAADRRDGIEALAAARGLHGASLDGVRALAAMLEVTSIIALPAAVLALTSALLAGALGPGLRLLAISLALTTFASVCGVTLGGLAAASSRAAGPRGRTLFAALILVPWALADLAGHAAWSIPGALDAFLTFAVALAGGSS